MAIQTASNTPHDVSATLNYYKATSDGAPPYAYYRDEGRVEPPEGVPSTNVVRQPVPVIIRDVRGFESDFSLDKHGFQFMKSPSTETSFSNDEHIKAYLLEIEALLKTVTGSKRVVVFNHAIRGPVAMNPGTFVHVDNTTESIPGFMSLIFPGEAEQLLEGRVRCINVWRPIHHPVAHHPLALAEWQHIDVGRDLVSIRVPAPMMDTAQYHAAHNSDHKWYYLHRQTPDEVVIFKCYDSKEEVARICLHTAFEDESDPPEAPQRESIEVRAFLID